MMHRVREAARTSLIALVAVPVLTGCGGAYYAVVAGGASASLEQAEAIGAEEKAPYEYYMAREHLRKAQLEASQGDYGDAIDLAEDAEAFADKAVTLAREAHQGAGR